jgi:hypothetical protein
MVSPATCPLLSAPNCFPSIPLRLPQQDRVPSHIIDVVSKYPHPE